MNSRIVFGFSVIFCFILLLFGFIFSDIYNIKMKIKELEIRVTKIENRIDVMNDHEKQLCNYVTTFMKRPYETIWGVKDDKNGKTITIYSTFDTTHPECPFVLVEDYKRSGSE